MNKTKFKKGFIDYIKNIRDSLSTEFVDEIVEDEVREEEMLNGIIFKDYISVLDDEELLVETIVESHLISYLNLQDIDEYEFNKDWEFRDKLIEKAYDLLFKNKEWRKTIQNYITELHDEYNQL